MAHIEVQGSRDPDFSERMFRYFYRVYDKYDRKIFALALFSDKSPSYKPDTYHYEFFTTALTYTYRTYKILEQNEEELVCSDNPFSMAVLAGLYVVKSKKRCRCSLSIQNQVDSPVAAERVATGENRKVIYLYRQPVTASD